VKQEKGTSINRKTLIAELVWGKTMDTIEQKASTIDQQCILENAAEVERSVGEVIKRPRYFQWSEHPQPIGIASGASKRHPDPFSCSWGPSRYWSPSMHSEFQLNRRGNHGQ